MQRRFFALSLLAGRGLLTAGCGGGGGGTASPLPVPYPVPTPDPDPATGTFAYVARPGLDDVSVSQVLASGALRVAGTAPAEAGTSSVALHPSGLDAYAVNTAARTISIYVRDRETGLLSLMRSLEAASGGAPTHLRFHPSGEIAYVAEEGSMTSYAVDVDTGELEVERYFACMATDFKLDRTGQFAFVASDVGRLTSYRLEGYVLTEVNSVSTGASGGVPSDVAMSPSGGLCTLLFKLVASPSIVSNKTVAKSALQL